MVDDAFWEGLVTPVQAPVHVDDRGLLTAVTLTPYDFRAVRAFTVVAPDGTVRGGHGHHRGRQLLLRVGGRVRVEVRRGDRTCDATLDRDLPGLLIEPGVWSRQTYLGDDAALVVLCDTEYDPSDYFADPGTYS